ncbi:MAG: hypothetical protein ABI824_01650 [Acidobacteriota bacterium]
MRSRNFVLCVLLLGALSCPLWMRAQGASQPETVMVTFHVKPGREAELQKVIARHWTSVVARKMVLPTPHVTLRGTEDGDKTYFVEIFTWRDAQVPDTAPAGITDIWNQMNQLVEARGGKDGLVFVPVSLDLG